jgi:hypothetical protein
LHYVKFLNLPEAEIGTYDGGSNRRLDPNRMGWRTIWTYIRELSSNLGSHIGYPEDFRGFPQSLQANAGVVFRLGYDRSVPNSFELIIIPASGATQSTILKASLNNCRKEEKTLLLYTHHEDSKIRENEIGSTQHATERSVYIGR